MNNNEYVTKPHYEILDGLRGLAAVVVLVFHIYEAYAVEKYTQMINHGYMAVDFFFVLSGFVIGYAYDERWGKMTLGNFFKRRIIRLHPMVVFGMVLGAALFYFGASTVFPLVAGTPVWTMLAYMLLGMLLIPTPPSADIRGWQEMHTLDAPCWSLFFEYIANILYALFIRRFSIVALSALVFVSACATVYLTLSAGDVIGGWTFNAPHLQVGFIRLIYPFFAGLLLYRLKKTAHIKHAFLWSSLLLLFVLFMPRIGDSKHDWMNGIYEAAVILAVFPLIVFLGANGRLKGTFAPKLCRFLGGISYPLYLINYPILYVHNGWISDTHYTAKETWWLIILLFVGIIALSYAVQKLYDEPVRAWLGKRFTKKQG
ncbi:MAG: acyltransferase [Prevotellaceae bacterium]|jgi:peptidoglycan/LPS O-acetylase OafA/YrhL|nr:acyltransferase [Prevotellaceae bacterium]